MRSAPAHGEQTASIPMSCSPCSATCSQPASKAPALPQWDAFFASSRRQA